MASLQLVEGLIGTICAIACLYYARQGVLATETSLHAAPIEYARRNPYAAVFGALALGFLISSWSMYALPRHAGIAPRTIEQPRIITKTVVQSDPAQAAKIAALQTTVNTDTQTIAAQTAEIDRLKGILTKWSHHNKRALAIIGANPAGNPQGTAAALNRAYNLPGAAPGTAAPASAPPSAPATAPGPSAQNPAAGNTASQSPATTPPH